MIPKIYDEKPENHKKVSTSIAINLLFIQCESS